MANTEVQITYNLNRSAHTTSAYCVSYAPSDQCCHDLRQIGETWNNVAHYRGVYATRREAEIAVDGYIGGEG